MAAKEDSGVPNSDYIKWMFVTLIVIGGVVGNYYFSEYPLYLRILGELFLLALASLLAVQTVKGRLLWHFLQEARSEMRKVVWPSKQETLQTTGIVILMVLIVALFLWLLDASLGKIASWVLGG